MERALVTQLVKSKVELVLLFQVPGHSPLLILRVLEVLPALGCSVALKNCCHALFEGLMHGVVWN